LFSPTLHNLAGGLEKFQFVKVDAITTADLSSGKTDAKMNRKNLNKRAEGLATKVSAAAKFCTQMTEGDFDGGRAGVQALVASLAEPADEL
jgi:hypothetical protein